MGAGNAPKVAGGGCIWIWRKVSLTAAPVAVVLGGVCESMGRLIVGTGGALEGVGGGGIWCLGRPVSAVATILYTVPMISRDTVVVGGLDGVSDCRPTTFVGLSDISAAKRRLVEFWELVWGYLVRITGVEEKWRKEVREEYLSTGSRRCDCLLES